MRRHGSSSSRSSRPREVLGPVIEEGSQTTDEACGQSCRQSYLPEEAVLRRVADEALARRAARDVSIILPTSAAVLLLCSSFPHSAVAAVANLLVPWASILSMAAIMPAAPPRQALPYMLVGATATFSMAVAIVVQRYTQHVHEDSSLLVLYVASAAAFAFATGLFGVAMCVGGVKWSWWGLRVGLGSSLTVRLLVILLLRYALGSPATMYPPGAPFVPALLNCLLWLVYLAFLTPCARHRLATLSGRTAVVLHLHSLHGASPTARDEQLLVKDTVRLVAENQRVREEIERLCVPLPRHVRHAALPRPTRAARGHGGVNAGDESQRGAAWPAASAQTTSQCDPPRARARRAAGRRYGPSG